MKNKRNMLKYLLSMITTLMIIHGYSQSCHGVKELLRKRHTISGMTYGHPYTTFDRHQIGGFDLENEIQKIRDRIVLESDPLNKGNVYLAYQSIYQYVTITKPTQPTDEGLPKGSESDLALWAKYNAFIFLVGIERYRCIIRCNRPVWNDPKCF